MSRSFLLLASLTLLPLGACQENTITADEANDPQAKELAKAAPVQLPPSIRAAKTYRCKDNSLVYITFMDDGVTALVRDKQEEPPLATLRAAGEGEPFVAEGFSVSGSGPTVTYKSPDSGSQTCNS